MQELSLKAADDWHCHLRAGAALSCTVTDHARQFQRAIVMPNLEVPITDVEMALSYRQRILQHVPRGAVFTPLMTLYITSDMTPATVQQACQADFVYACKLYPAGVTTHSDAGVEDLKSIYPLLEVMQQHGLPLLIHGEVNDASVDIFDREAVFIERHLVDIISNFPRLKIVLEHITTAFAVDFIKQATEYVAATITAHHLWCNRNALFVQGIRPHYYCLPILKREQDRQALIAAATGAHPRFFLGTDSAPHAQSHKEAACGCAGIYTAHAALPLYAQIFEQQDALHNLEAFASIHGPQFYDLPLNQNTVTLRREAWQVPENIAFGDTQMVPFLAGETLNWQVVN